MIALRETAAGVSLSVRVHPRSSRTAVVGVLGDALRVSLAAPPVEGKANETLIRFFADLFQVQRSAVEILSGESSRNKVIRIAGVTSELVRSRLGL